MFSKALVDFASQAETTLRQRRRYANGNALRTVSTQLLSDVIYDAGDFDLVILRIYLRDRILVFSTLLHIQYKVAYKEAVILE
jgi:hypothetical protein